MASYRDIVRDRRDYSVDCFLELYRRHALKVGCELQAIRIQNMEQSFVHQDQTHQRQELPRK